MKLRAGADAAPQLSPWRKLPRGFPVRGEDLETKEQGNIHESSTSS